MARNYLTDCTLQNKMDMAISKGAVGVLVYYDPGTTGLFGSGLTTLAPFPAFSLTYDLGQFFIELIQDTFVVNMYSLTEAPPVVTMNILADTPTGDPSNTIVVGSHLDSVPAGPGINDNGSGSSVNLEMALELYEMNIKLKNRVRFAWWAAEEFGLLGSTYYVGSLTSQEKSEIALNLNFDMMGSPNYFRGVYNGSGAAQDIVKGCVFLQTIFEEWFAVEGLFYDLTPFTGRSDYGPFITNGIPAGGLDTGAEKIKTAEQRSRYGGLANTAYDPCYHIGCDTTENINQVVLRDMSQAAANALEYLSTLEDLRSYL
jgi:Zn-dependent M28 family amino/carboxypeptidase